MFFASYGKKSEDVGLFINATNLSQSIGAVNMQNFNTKWVAGGIGGYITGKMDDVRLYNRKLSTNEINSVRLEGRQ